MIISPMDPETACNDDNAGLIVKALNSWPALLLLAGIGIAIVSVESVLTTWRCDPWGKILVVGYILFGLAIVWMLTSAITYSPPAEPYVPFASSVPPELLSVAYDNGTIAFANPSPGTTIRIEMVQNGLLSSTSLYSVDLAYGESASFPAADLDEVRVSKIDGNTTEFSRYYVRFGRDSERRSTVRIKP